MIRFFCGLVLIVSALVILAVISPAKFYFTPKQERLYDLWQSDLSTLYQDKKFSKVFNNLSKVEIHFTDPQVAEEFANFRSPFKVQPSPHGFVLKISITRWIETSDYGFVIQHELFDQSDDKIYEFGRTYKVGLIF